MAKETKETGTSATGKFSAEERAAMKDRAAEVRLAAKREKSANKAAENLQDVLTKISEMSEPDRTLATKAHNLIMEAAPNLEPRTWYSFPAYALEGKILCFFQGTEKFGVRYSTLGFNDLAQLDQGTMWPTAYALTDLTNDDEKIISALIAKAVGGK